MENYVNSLNLGFLICKRRCWEDEMRGQVKFREELAHRKCSKVVHGCWVGGIIPLLFETVFLISEGSSQQHSCSGLFFTKELSIWSCSWWELPTSWLSGKESACSAGDLGSIPRLGRSPGGGHGNLLQYSCLENPRNGGTWQTTVHGVARARHDLATKPPQPVGIYHSSRPYL